MPTLAKLAGGGVPAEADGHDKSDVLWPTSSAGSTCQRSADTISLRAASACPSCIFLEVGYGRAVVDGKWKLVRVPRPETGANGEDLSKRCSSWYGDALPTTRMVYSNFDLHPDTYCKETMLFDLEADPWEDNDLADSEKGKVEAMMELLQGHLDAAGEVVWRYLTVCGVRLSLTRSYRRRWTLLRLDVKN